VTTIIVKKDFTATDIREARMKAAEHRRSKATSGATNVLDFSDLKKTVVLCDDHFRAFRSTARKNDYYEQREYPYVMSNCDYCKIFCRCQMFIHESVLKQVWNTRDQDRRDREYATVVNG
jgi:hypothetical protein